MEQALRTLPLEHHCRVLLRPDDGNDPAAICDKQSMTIVLEASLGAMWLTSLPSPYLHDGQPEASCQIEVCDKNPAGLKL